MPFLNYGNEDFVFSKLPYAFQRRLIYLASEQEKFDNYSSVYLTDNRHAYSSANKAVSNKRELDFVQYFADGPFTFSPTWQSVLLVDDILDERKPLFISDTLILNLKYTKYSQFKSLVSGSYSRLVIYGEFIESYNRWTWDEIKTLIHDKVKQVRIINAIAVNPKEYDDVVNFVLRFGRDVDCKFSFHENTFSSKLLEKVKTSCQHHETHSLVTSRQGMTHFIDKRRPSAYYLYSLLWVLVHVSVLSAQLFLMDYVDPPGQKVKITETKAIIFHCGFIVILTISLITTGFCLLYPCLVVVNILRDNPPFDD